MKCSLLHACLFRPCYLPYRLTSWSRMLSVRLIAPQVVTKFPITNLIVTSNSPSFMELKGSLLHSQEVTTSYYPQSDQSSPCPTSYFLKINFNVTFPSKPTSSQWSLSLRFPHPNPVCTSPFPHTRYMTHPSNSSRFDHLNNIMCAVWIIKVLITALIQSQQIKVHMSFEVLTAV